MTLILDLDLSTMKMYLCAKMKFIDQSFQKLEPEQDKQTHRQTDIATERITVPHRTTSLQKFCF